MLGPDCWLTGAEKGFSDYPMWHGVDTTDNTTHGRPIAADATHGNPHGTWFKVWESDCSNYNGCHPWFFGGDHPQPLPAMMAHWEQTYGASNRMPLHARRTVGMRLALLATERQFWHRGAHTAGAQRSAP